MVRRRARRSDALRVEWQRLREKRSAQLSRQRQIMFPGDDCHAEPRPQNDPFLKRVDKQPLFKHAVRKSMRLGQVLRMMQCNATDVAPRGATDVAYDWR